MLVESVQKECLMWKYHFNPRKPLPKDIIGIARVFGHFSRDRIVCVWNPKKKVWGFPGGHVEANIKETPMEAGIREYHEEVHIVLEYDELYELGQDLDGAHCIFLFGAQLTQARVDACIQKETERRVFVLDEIAHMPNFNPWHKRMLFNIPRPRDHRGLTIPVYQTPRYA